MVEDALSIVRSPGADLWVVQKDTNGPFAETSAHSRRSLRVVRAVPGVREASPIAFQSVQLVYVRFPCHANHRLPPGNLGGAAGGARAAARRGSL